jgi:hypothetical protein
VDRNVWRIWSRRAVAASAGSPSAITFQAAGAERAVIVILDRRRALWRLTTSTSVPGVAAARAADPIRLAIKGALFRSIKPAIT